MAEGMEKLAELKTDDKGAATTADAQPQKETANTQEKPVYVQKIDEHGRSYGTGRRKDSVARVWLKRGSGQVTVNGRDQTIYFARPTQRMILNQPFEKTAREGQFDVICTVSGGGLSGQAGAVRHGIARALCNFEPELRPELKKAGHLTRDARKVERKKYGKRKARRSRQWNKR